MTPSSLVMPSLGLYAVLVLVIYFILAALGHFGVPIPPVLMGIVATLFVILSFLGR